MIETNNKKNVNNNNENNENDNSNIISNNDDNKVKKTSNESDNSNVISNNDDNKVKKTSNENDNGNGNENVNDLTLNIDQHSRQIIDVSIDENELNNSNSNSGSSSSSSSGIDNNDTLRNRTRRRRTRNVLNKDGKKIVLNTKGEPIRPKKKLKKKSGCKPHKLNKKKDNDDTDGSNNNNKSPRSNNSKQTKINFKSASEAASGNNNNNNNKSNSNNNNTKSKASSCDNSSSNQTNCQLNGFEALHEAIAQEELRTQSSDIPKTKKKSLDKSNKQKSLPLHNEMDKITAKSLSQPKLNHLDEVMNELQILNTNGNNNQMVIKDISKEVGMDNISFEYNNKQIGVLKEVIVPGEDKKETKHVLAKNYGYLQQAHKKTNAKVQSLKDLYHRAKPQDQQKNLLYSKFTKTLSILELINETMNNYKKAMNLV